MLIDPVLVLAKAKELTAGSCTEHAKIIRTDEAAWRNPTPFLQLMCPQELLFQFQY
jgi:hypothetical protein